MTEMITRYMLPAILAGLLLAGCTKNADSAEETGTGQATATPPTEVTPPPGTGTSTGAERPTLTRAECTAKNGKIVGDIGNGAIHRPDYTCESGQPPIGTIRPAEGEPIATEGEVCCP